MSARYLGAGLTRLLLAGLALGLLGGCPTPSTTKAKATKTPAPVAASTPKTPSFAGNWLVTGGGAVRENWKVEQTGLRFSGTITTESGGAILGPSTIAGEFYPVGDAWRVRMESPTGNLALSADDEFLFCVGSGTAGCKQGLKRYFMPSPPTGRAISPAPVESGATTP